jgi:hypothetical protein
MRAIILSVTLAVAFGYASPAQDVRLGTNSVVSFATLESARRVLTNRDDFIKALSPFDRSARMKVDRDVGEGEFLEFVSGAAQPWTSEETHRLTGVLHSLQRRLVPWNLPLPSSLLLLKTSGAEEGNASYTRSNAIVLAQEDLQRPSSGLEDLIAHELFHVISRHDPELRKRLYRIVGFNPINEISLPENLRPRKITNPDGVQNGWMITVTNNGQAISTVPILYSSNNHFDPNRGGEFFSYLVFKLLAVTNGPGGWQPVLVAGNPQLIDPGEASGYFEQVGRNTDYIIHPDEILAVNFVHLINGRTNVATPRILSEMKELLMQR